MSMSKAELDSKLSRMTKAERKAYQASFTKEEQLRLFGRQRRSGGGKKVIKEAR